MADQLRKLQLIQLEILKDVAAFCEKRNLTYFLFGGTLIGAIRHNGFIPWDDDVDIAMYRGDYERFIEAFPKENGDKYFVQNNHNDKGYSRFITKIRLNGTKQVERDQSKIDMHHGIYIDIFPLDYVPDANSFGLKLRGFIVRMLFAFSSLRAGKRDHKSKLKDILKRTLRLLTYIIPMNVVNESFDRICKISNENKCEYTTCFASGYRWKKQLVKNDVYSKGQNVEFEGYKFNVPSQYNVLLTQIYGDFMKLPPLEKRRSVHTLDIIDFGPYNSLFERETIK